MSNITSPNLLWILYALNDGGQYSQKQICKNWSIPKSSVNTVIKDLEAKNYVELNPIPGKRREMAISLTKSGKEYANAALKDIYQKEKKAFKKLKDANLFLEQFELLANILSKIND